MSNASQSLDLRFGCPFCGASSNERCISDYTSEYMDDIHGERLLFAGAHDASLDRA